MDLVLASKSPRRQFLLEKMGIEFKIEESYIDENINNFNSIPSLVMSLAYEKAFDVAHRIQMNALVIGADTIVYKDKLLGKPRDENDAYNMLKMLSGSVHNVFTGVALVNLSKNIKIVDYSKTKVWFRELSDELIYEYIRSGEPFDKAGGYGIQDKGMRFVDKIEGDFYNVVGLPVSKLIHLIEKVNLK